MGRIESYIYFNDYYTPLKINEDGSFECIKYEGTTNYFCKFKISNFEIEEIQMRTVLESKLIILDFLRIDEDIYFHTICSDCPDCQTIYKQTGNEYKIIYRTTNKILKLFNKKNFLVFIEKDECKCIDLESLEIDKISMRGEEPDT